jgi:hypothetical protein
MSAAAADCHCGTRFRERGKSSPQILDWPRANAKTSWGVPVSLPAAFELTLKTATAIVFIAMCPVRRFLAFESSALF